MSPHISIAATLERQRLEHRSQRIARVIHALRERERAIRPGAPVPAGLLAAIRDWENQAREVERRLAELDRAPAEAGGVRTPVAAAA